MSYFELGFGHLTSYILCAGQRASTTWYVLSAGLTLCGINTGRTLLAIRLYVSPYFLSLIIRLYIAIHEQSVRRPAS